MTAEAWLLIAWILFGGSHVLGSSSLVRPRIVARLGLMGFKAAYSLVAFATFVPLVWYYFAHKHAGETLFSAGPWWNAAGQALMLISLLVLFQGLLTLNPISTAAELSGRYPRGPRGIQRITRHPVNASFALFGLAHAATNPWLGDAIFFLGFLAYAVLSALHQDRRVAATGSPEAQAFIEQTSLVPFQAILDGRQRLSREGWSVAGLLAGLAAFLVLRTVHGRLFGGVIIGP